MSVHLYIVEGLTPPTPAPRLCPAMTKAGISVVAFQRTIVGIRSQGAADSFVDRLVHSSHSLLRWFTFNG